MIARSDETSIGRPGQSAADNRRAGRTRRIILDAAAAELVERDGRLEIGAVAARAGVSVGISYHHFGSKAGLLAAVVEDFYDRYDAAVIDRNPLPGAGWADRERNRVERLADFMFAEPLAPLVLSRLSAEPEVAAAEARRMARHIELGAANIAGAQAKGELPAGPDSRLRIGMILGGVRHALGQALSEPGRWQRERLVEELWDFVAMAAGRSRPASTEPSTPRIRAP